MHSFGKCTSIFDIAFEVDCNASLIGILLHFNEKPVVSRLNFFTNVVKFTWLFKLLNAGSINFFRGRLCRLAITRAYGSGSRIRGEETLCKSRDLMFRTHGHIFIKIDKFSLNCAIRCRGDRERSTHTHTERERSWFFLRSLDVDGGIKLKEIIAVWYT